ncbi:very long chain fatty acid elongase F-like [Drosophila kikkawai]|uniref:Elongation of very long chain fatty acids protein n=1 Tax=Drosophila kikkawai TaxID=30033 RepID=A0A6P4JQG1_DROKI|nr:elongation of very long chain fatty acids protein F-like [Drosophila kikkawai]
MTSTDPIRLAFFRSPWPTLGALAAYLLFVLKLGPKLMDSRKPFELRGVIKAYNIIQIVYNSALFVLVCYVVYNFYDWRCPLSLPWDHEGKDIERLFANAYYINKYLDLVETVFFVLRKKSRQISFLHVFHHVAVILASYLTQTLYDHGGLVAWMVVLNLIVHACMYTYYLLSSISPEVQKASLWWKKYITTIQLIQFALIMLHMIDMLMQSDCKAPRPGIYAFGFLYSALTVMFSKFYYQSYISPSQKNAKRSS